jgi:hypothetical protein
MKTKNNIQKTVNGQIRKMILNGSVLLAIMVLISWSVNGQAYWNNFFNTIEQQVEFEKADALAEAVNAEMEKKFHNSVKLLTVESENEKNLGIEIWMTNEALFTGKFEVIEETDKSLNLEGWMVKSPIAENSKNYIQAETDQTLKVEEWMTNEFTFNSSNILSEKDADLDLESWMIEDSIFTSKIASEGKTLKLEAWMADENFWGF